MPLKRHIHITVGKHNFFVLKRSLLYIILTVESISICLAQKNQAEELLKLGVQCIENGKVDSALYYWNRVIDMDSSYVEAFFNRAMVNYQHKKYQQAISDLSFVLDKHPNDKQALQFRSICKDSIGDILGAEEDRKIAEEIVEFPEASIRVHGIVDEEYIEKGDQWINAGNYEKGIEYYSQVIELSPSKFEPYYKRAYAYLDLGEIEKAMHDLKIADSIQPNNASILAEIAYCHYYREETKMGLKYCKEALAIDELHPTANYYAGMLELQAENNKEGLDFLLKAISFGYNTGRAYFNLGVAYYFLEDMDNACKNWEISKDKGFTRADEMLNEHCK